MDLDAMLDDVASTHLPPAAVPTTVVRNIEAPEIKPWLAATANVSPTTRDTWTQMVRKDLKANVTTKFQPSNAYRKFDSAQQVNVSTKLLLELVRNAAAKCNFDETKTSKLMNMVNPMTDFELGGQLQTSYKAQLIKDLKQTAKKDVNYNATVFTSLASVN
jgi:hypothetical protein